MYLHRLYGLVVAAARQLPAPTATGTPDIIITEHSDRQVASTPPNRFGYSYEIRSDRSVHVSFSDLFDFLVSADGTRIDVHTGAPSGAEPAYNYLISQIISIALLQRGIESLHASAVAIDGQAFVLLGESGHGKSTLTAALVQQGARLITDDLLVLQQNGSSYAAVAGAGRVKLAPATAAQLTIAWPGVPMADGSGKYVYSIADFAAVQTPVALMLVLAPNAQRVAIEPLSAAEATRAVLAATFNPLHTEAARLAFLLEHARRVIASISVFRLHVPRDFRQLGSVVNLVKEVYNRSMAGKQRLSR